VFLAEPEGGSRIRGMAPMSEHGDSLQFFHLNTGKQSLVVDQGSAEFERLLAGADVAVLPVGAGADSLSAKYPALIVVQPSDFGTDGPRADWQGAEIVLQALSGMMHNNGAAGREPLFGTGNRASL